MSNTNHEPKHARPVHEVRIGLIRAAVWANSTRDAVIHNVTFERRYRDGEEWKSTNSFGRDDLLKLAKVADEAHSWISQQSSPKKDLTDLTSGNQPKPAANPGNPGTTRRVGS